MQEIVVVAVYLSNGAYEVVRVRHVDPPDAGMWDVKSIDRFAGSLELTKGRAAGAHRRRCSPDVAAAAAAPPARDASLRIEPDAAIRLAAAGA